MEDEVELGRLLQELQWHPMYGEKTLNEVKAALSRVTNAVERNGAKDASKTDS